MEKKKSDVHLTRVESRCEMLVAESLLREDYSALCRLDDTGRHRRSVHFAEPGGEIGECLVQTRSCFDCIAALLSSRRGSHHRARFLRC